MVKGCVGSGAGEAAVADAPAKHTRLKANFKRSADMGWLSWWRYQAIILARALRRRSGRPAAVGGLLAMLPLANRAVQGPAARGSSTFAMPGLSSRHRSESEKTPARTAHRRC